MSFDEAEPSADRNHPTQHEIFGQLVEFGEAAGNVGHRVVRRNITRRSVAILPYRRPNSGYVMRFSVEPIEEWGERDEEIPENVSNGIPSVRILPNDAITLNAVGALSVDVIQALLDVPDVPLRRFHEIRAARASTQRRSEVDR